MSRCSFPYCRARVPAGAVLCERCGFPRDKAQLFDPALFQAGVERLRGRLPERILDMHQILPAFPGIAEFQLKAMAALGITQALLQSAPPEAKSLLGDDALFEVAQAHPGRFWPSAFVDPTHEQALQQLEAAADRGVRVLKLLPVAGYELDDPALNPFWELAESRRMVMLIHQGFITGRHKDEERRAGQFMSSRFANPLYVDRPARQFPGVTFILAHAGGAIFYEQAAQMVSQHDNVWADLSGTGLFALQRFLQLSVALDTDKLFWGNDGPPFAYPITLRLLVQTLEQHDEVETLLPALLFDNGRTFADLHLED